MYKVDSVQYLILHESLFCHQPVLLGLQEMRSLRQCAHSNSVCCSESAQVISPFPILFSLVWFLSCIVFEIQQ